MYQNETSQYGSQIFKKLKTMTAWVRPLDDYGVSGEGSSATKMRFSSERETRWLRARVRQGLWCPSRDFGSDCPSISTEMDSCHI